MSSTQLLADLRNAGLTVVEEPKWKTRGNKWRTDGKPEGIMQHHTALPNPYPIKKLYGAPLFRTKANMATHENGVVYLIAYGACNYSSGPGSKKVLTGNIRPHIPPPDNARDRGLHDTIGYGGNRYYWNYENSHPGDGSPIPKVQFDSIVLSTQIVAAHFGLTWEQVISHAEHTRRKIDPRWNGSNRTAIEQIRAGVSGAAPIPPDPPPSGGDWTKEIIMAWPTVRRDDGYNSKGTGHLNDDVKTAQGLLLARGFPDQNSADPKTAADGFFGPGTELSTKQFQASRGLSQDGIVGQKTWTELAGQ
jgi:Putative peptidoglycan binding domain